MLIQYVSKQNEHKWTSMQKYSSISNRFTNCNSQSQFFYTVGKKINNMKHFLLQYSNWLTQLYETRERERERERLAPGQRNSRWA